MVDISNSMVLIVFLLYLLLYSILENFYLLLLLDKYDINNYEEFIRKGLSNSKNPLYINEADCITTLQEITDLIHKSGGSSFIAHLYKYQIENHIEFLRNMIQTIKGIKGVECNYYSLTEEQNQ